jgi:hypothetical protein
MGYLQNLKRPRSGQNEALDQDHFFNETILIFSICFQLDFSEKWNPFYRISLKQPEPGSQQQSRAGL